MTDETKTEFVIPEALQEKLRELDKRGNDLRQALGSLELEYLGNRNSILNEFERNKQAYNQIIEEAVKASGLSTPAKEVLNYDPQTMTIKKVPPPSAPPASA